VATNLNILSVNEIKLFDSPPEFNSHQRIINFAPAKWAENIMNDMRSDENKLIFCILLGYFKFSKKFYTPVKFHKKDIIYVSSKFNLKIDNEKIINFKRYTLTRYYEIILKNLGIRPFTKTIKNQMFIEAKELVKKMYKPKNIFISMLEPLILKNIEVPNYNIFAEIITAAFNDYEKELLLIADKKLTLIDKALLDNLLKIDEKYYSDNNDVMSEKDSKVKRYKITRLKKINYSTKPNKIKENIANMIIFKNLFYCLSGTIKDLNLSNETIKYYAYWTSKTDVFSINRKEESKIYLALICFLIHQYFTLQDTLIDSLLNSVNTIINSAIKDDKEKYFVNRKEREMKTLEIIDIAEKSFNFTKYIKKITFDPVLGDHEKIEKIKLVLEMEEKSYLKIENNFKIIKTETKKKRVKSEYYQILEEKYRKLQNRVSNIIKNISFNENSLNKNLIKAIKYFKSRNGDVNHDAPIEFLEDELKDEIIDNEGKFRPKLYKMFLFENIAEAINTGSLSLLNSYRFRDVNSYMIDETFLKENKDELIEKAGLQDFVDVKKVLANLVETTKNQYKKTNKNILLGHNHHIEFRAGNNYVLNTPKVEKEESNSVSGLFENHKNISLLEVLSVINENISFTDSLEHPTVKYMKERPLASSFIAAIIGYGCNIGNGRMAKISKNIKESELETISDWYLSLENIQTANNKILALMNKLDLPNILKKDKKITHTSSDGQKFGVGVDSHLAHYSYKYLGLGKVVTAYTFIDDRHFLFHSTVISSTDREAAYVIDGLMNNDVVKSDIHSTDTHGYTEAIFGATHGFGFSYAPRIKNFRDQKLYCFTAEEKKEYEKKGYKILPNAQNYINLKLIEDNWEEVLRFLISINLKYTDASQIFKRLSSYGKKHKLYRALQEFGKIIKTIFLLRYIDELELRQMIEKQLNKVENSNKFAKAVFFGNNQEFQYGSKEEQDKADSCKRLIENSIICWNYLYLSHLISKTNGENNKKGILKVIKNGSVVVWQHINLYGEYDFSENNLKDSVGFNINEILELNFA
jgi:TnpA family transposase